MSEPLRIEQDEEAETVTVNGITFSFEFFTMFEELFPPGKLVRVICDEDKSIRLAEYAPGETVVA